MSCQQYGRLDGRCKYSKGVCSVVQLPPSTCTALHLLLKVVVLTLVPGGGGGGTTEKRLRRQQKPEGIRKAPALFILIRLSTPSILFGLFGVFSWSFQTTTRLWHPCLQELALQHPSLLPHAGRSVVEQAQSLSISASLSARHWQTRSLRGCVTVRALASS